MIARDTRGSRYSVAAGAFHGVRHALTVACAGMSLAGCERLDAATTLRFGNGPTRAAASITQPSAVQPAPDDGENRDATTPRPTSPPTQGAGYPEGSFCWKLFGPVGGLHDLGSRCRNHAVHVATEILWKINCFLPLFLLAVAVPLLSERMARVPRVGPHLQRIGICFMTFLSRRSFREVLTGYAVLMLGVFVLLTWHYEAHCPTEGLRWCDEIYGPGDSSAEDRSRPDRD